MTLKETPIDDEIKPKFINSPVTIKDRPKEAKTTKEKPNAKASTIKQSTPRPMMIEEKSVDKALTRLFFVD